MINLWYWWIHELSLLMPPWFRLLFYINRQGLIFIRFANFQVDLYVMEDEIEKKLAHFYLHNEGKKQCEAFLNSRSDLQDAEKILLLSSNQVLRRNLSLPIAAQENLNQVVSYELDRYTPLKADQACFSAQMLGKNKENTQIYVELTCISQEKMNYYFNEFMSWGMPVDVICYDYGVEGIKSASQAQRYNLLSKELRPIRGNHSEIYARIFGICFFVLMFWSIVYPFWLQTSRLNDLEQQVAEAHRKSEQVEQIKSDANLTLELARKVNDLKQQSPSILNIMQQLTVLLPENTWLKSFEYSENKLRLEGSSKSSSALIGLLEASPYFKQTGFVSPVVQGSSQGLDMFTLETRIEANTNGGGSL